MTADAWLYLAEGEAPLDAEATARANGVRFAQEPAPQ